MSSLAPAPVGQGTLTQIRHWLRLAYARDREAACCLSPHHHPLAFLESPTRRENSVELYFLELVLQNKQHFKNVNIHFIAILHILFQTVFFGL